MKKQNRNRRLTLNAERIRTLVDQDLMFAQGGRIKTTESVDPTVETCPISERRILQRWLALSCASTG